LGGTLPLVPAAHALKPDGADASILDPSGTTTDEEPPRATTSPAFTLLQIDCSGSGCKYPKGHRLHFTLPFLLENLPGGQGMHDTEPVLLVYAPLEQGICDEFAPAHVWPRWQMWSTPFNVYDPGGTALQPVEPFPALPHPLGQFKHDVLPAVVWNVPTLHC
jgi:hypothetical protein